MNISEDNINVPNDSEDRMRLILSSARAMTFDLTPEGSIIGFDDLTENLSGISRIDAKGKPFVELFLDEKDRAEFKSNLDNVAQGAVFTNYEKIIIIKNGYRRTAIFSAIPKFNDKGDVNGITLAGQDVTELRVTQKRHKENEELLRRIIASAPVFAFTCEKTGELGYISRGSDRFFGIGSAHMKNNPTIWLKQFHKEDYERFVATLQKLSPENQQTDADFRITNKTDNLTRWYDIRLYFDPKKDKANIQGIAIDVTERKIAEEERNHLEAQVRQGEKLQVLGQLAGGVAHDFNNLLAGIVGAAELLMIESLPKEKHKHFVDIILESAGRASELNQQLMSFARKGNYDSVPVDINELIHKTVHILRHTISKNIYIKESLKAKHSSILGDPTQLQNALLNLAINARDAMPDGGSLYFETMDCPKPQCEGHRTVIKVRDTGEGIHEDVRDKIFDPFFTTKPEGKGNGLGLISVLTAVDNHCGEIELDSEPGSGTEFRIFLPVDIPHHLPETENQNNKTATKGQGNIIIVDDEPLIRETMAEILTSLGYHVHHFDDGTKAVEKINSGEFDCDLAILDMVMPKINGVETLKRMRKIRPDLKAIMATGCADRQAVDEAMLQGAIGLLKKPIKIADLSQAIENAIKA